MFSLPFSDNGSESFLYKPHPLTTFFNIAQSATSMLPELRKKVLYERGNADNGLVNMNNYFSQASLAVNYMYVSFETLLNLLIARSESPIIIDSVEKSKDDLMNYQSFSDKNRIVLSKLRDEYFFSLNPSALDSIDNLKVFRNELVHFKVNPTDPLFGYDEQILKSMNFGYKKTLEIVKEFINFYYPNCIEDRNCGK